MAFGFLALLLFLCSTTCLLAWVIASSILPTKTRKKNLPPKAKGAWPIIGHLHTKLNHTALTAMADEYGPIFTVQLGGTTAVVVSSSELVKEIFTNHDLAVSSRPSYRAIYYFGYDIMFGFTPYGPYWREMRKLSTVHLLSNAKLDLMKGIRVSEVEESIKDLYKTWIHEDGCRDKTGGWVTVDMTQLVSDMTLNIIVRMVVGKRYYGSGSKSEESRRCQAALREFFDMVGTSLLGDFVPYLRWLDWGGYEKSMKKSSRELDSLIQKWLDEHRLARQELGDSLKDSQDFMDVLLTILDGTENLGYDSDTINKATCINMILAGTDTTSVNLGWAFSLLLNNRQALQKVQEELDNIVGRDRQVKESDIPNLPYVQAIVKETMRLYPATPLSSPRYFDQDVVISDYHVSKGSWLIVNLHKIHRDPQFWPDPLEFQPERFLTTHKGVDITGKSFELMPFGSGRRSCPAASFGLGVVHLALASFLHAFDFSTLSNAAVDMEEGFGLTVPRANPLNVLLAPRLAAHLYV